LEGDQDLEGEDSDRDEAGEDRDVLPARAWVRCWTGSNGRTR